MRPVFSWPQNPPVKSFCPKFSPFHPLSFIASSVLRPTSSLAPPIYAGKHGKPCFSVVVVVVGEYRGEKAGELFGNGFKDGVGKINRGGLGCFVGRRK